MKSAGDNRHGGWVERLVANDSCADGSIRLYLDGWLLTTHNPNTHTHRRREHKSDPNCTFGKSSKDLKSLIMCVYACGFE